MRRSLVLLTVVAALGAADVRAQGASDAGRSPACYRFAFGSWTPPLDWANAGHDSATRGYLKEARPSGSVHAGAASNGRRESAVLDSIGGVQQLILLPSWWPAGVTVRFPVFASASDTVRGTAQAFVADGRAEVPTAQVAVWRVQCGGGAPPR